MKKILSFILILSLSFSSLLPVAYAEESAVTPTPEVTTTSIENTTPTTNTETTQSQVTTTPTPTPNPVAVQMKNEIDKQVYNDLVNELSQDENIDVQKTLENTPIGYLAVTPTPQPENTSIGGATVETGDATSNTGVTNTGNNNFTGSQVGSGGTGASLTGEPTGVQVVNDGNGAGSSNSGSATVVNNDNTTQNNNANVYTGLTQGAVTGSNDSSFNTGANSTVTTGDANTTGTVVNAVNTNVDGVAVYEFNIADDVTGDYVLDFGSLASCIAGCGGSLNATNTNNGAYSTNGAQANTTNNSTTTQNNNATIGTDMTLFADSGNNDASFNTGGDTLIQTGDANVAANALTFANNNIAGNVVFTVINIFGDLVGDIIFPESQFDSCCGSNANVTNTNNGALSDNTSGYDSSNTSNTFQNNDADIANNLILDGSTGSNNADFNTGGNSTVNTGNVNIDANVLNIANTNLYGGNMWLVLINEAGNWVGKLMGAPEGAKFAGSEGSEFSMDENGYITVSNNANGAGSENNAGVSQTNNNTTNQNNDANIVNNLHLSANTGGNTANFNTGGNTTVQTGDANIVANMVNFVNNNIVGNGKLFVTVVNVFGSWMGDFVSPGHEKESDGENHVATTGTNNNSSSQNSTTQQSANNTQKNGGNNSSVESTIKKFFTAKTNGTGTTQVTENEGTGQAMVKGVKASNETLTLDASQRMTINLAWLVLLLPLALFALLTKRIMSRRMLPHRS